MTGPQRHDPDRSNTLILAAETLTLALEGSRLAVWDWNVRSDDIWLSKEWAVMLGRPAAETNTTSAALAGSVHPADLPRVMEALQSALRDPAGSYDIEHRVSAKDGYRWIRSRGRVSRRGKEGRPVRMTGTNSDIHARRMAEDNLRARERDLKLVTDSVPAMIAYVDTEEKLRFYNRAYALHFERGQSLIGRRLQDVIGEAAWKITGPHVKAALAGNTGTFERVDIDAAGVRRDLSMRYVPNVAEDGRVLGMYTLITDISELKALERMKDEFVATVSHELRMPLTSIRASLQTIASDGSSALPENLEETIRVAQGSCDRLVRLVGDILDLQRMRTGKLREETALVDLADVAKQSVDAAAGLARQRNVKLSLSTPPSLPKARANADRLIQVLTNLIGNSIKFSPEGDAVEVSVAHERDILVASVADRGPGIPAEFVPHMFERFSQAKLEPGMPRGGSGLGLAIAKAIVERYGGSMGYSPREGGGAVFRFNLPAA